MTTSPFSLQTFRRWAFLAVAPAMLLCGPVTTAHAIDYSLETDIGLGYDSNVFRAPSSSYTSNLTAALGGPVVVNPNTKSGLLVPLGLKGTGVHTLDEQTELKASYNFDGNFYLGSNLSNGNNTRHAVRIGGAHVFDKKGKRSRKLYLGITIDRLDKVYVDRDSGDRKLSSGAMADISNRYTYTGYGLEASYDNRISRVQYGVSGQLEVRDYSDPGAISQYDHNRYDVGGYATFRLAKRSKLKVSADYLIEDYDVRRARDRATATQTGNPALEYRYLTVAATLRQRLGRGFTAYAGYQLKLRADQFQGYNDYTANGFDLRLLYKKGVLNGRLAFAYSSRSYDNAFAYENPADAEKTYDTMRVKLQGGYELSEQLKLWSEVAYNVVDSNDLRYDYNRTQAMVGVRWAL